VGYAAKVERDVEGKLGEADVEKIKIEDDIFFSEIITTESDATAIMSFRDGSSLEIGPNSALTIDEFIFNPSEGIKTQTITALVGSFRFVSGMTLPNQKVTINTPSATIGIRGSTSPFTVGSDGSTAAAMTDGAASFAPRNNPGAAVNIQRGNAGVIKPGGQPRTGASTRSVARQLTSRTRQIFGARPVIPPQNQQRRTRDAQANQQPAATQTQQQVAAPTPAQQQAAQAAVAARQDQTMDNQGITSVTQLDTAGVLDAGPAALSANQQATVDNLDIQTQALQVNLDAGLQDGQAASQAAHQTGTANVIGGLAQIGDTDGVTAATGNAAQADPNQAGPAIGAAVSNLPNLDADTMTEVVQSAVNGLADGGYDTGTTTIGGLTAVALTSVDADTQAALADTVTNNVAGNNNIDVDDLSVVVQVAALEPAAGPADTVTDAGDTTDDVTDDPVVVDQAEAENPAQDVSPN
jgi:hypothetical protein